MFNFTRQYSVKDGLITDELASHIVENLPARYASAETWKRIYSLQHDGASLQTMYLACEKEKARSGHPKGACILAVRDTDGDVFGVFIPDYLIPAPHYFGSEETFLWKYFPPKKYVHYPFVGNSNFVAYCTKSFLAFGGGNGRYSLWLDGSLEYAYSSRTPAFENNPLSYRGCPDQRIQIVDIELWVLE
ncbi:TLDc domain-containing protein [Schizosaccharomyces pombe]|uniref:Oxidation resistance protein 1 n=1 Tax=Schizosaccharomyces pombe (strain 972 / ATCC 24843) TaxID=284812 RepID=OXR1_SCHPO|nr:TLDc domain protein 1 [Schizosaccharomyces pombe]O14284.1 RecName: Full=Oxidation resistance protein 1; AltName: Full=Meiotically up-regulated gene 63 protein [Schizosaccharomyces pombe 972h-]CAB16303.1 TLDc domain protein 1 [Schizosaccharomyces pombe]|eukprot:NP_594286.1 TLDc domain protein 1 [Schizosaccharomyces pombe]